MNIRPAQEEDVAPILDFWNPIIRDTTVSFANDEHTPETLLTLILSRRAQGNEFLVACDADEVLGLATYSQFRSNTGYRRTVEHTIILAPEARGRGVGRRLMAAIETHARVAGHHSIFAGVSGENDAGIAFHAAVGYVEVARLREVGWKFDRWLDLVLMQKML